MKKPRRNLLYDEDDLPEGSQPNSNHLGNSDDPDSPDSSYQVVEPRAYPADPSTTELLLGLPHQANQTSHTWPNQPPPSTPMRTELYPLSEAWHNTNTRHLENWQTQPKPKPQLQAPKLPSSKVEAKPKVIPQPQALQPKIQAEPPIGFWSIAIVLGGLGVIATVLVLILTKILSNAASEAITESPPLAIPAPSDQQSATPITAGAVASPATVATVTTPPTPVASSEPPPQALTAQPTPSAPPKTRATTQKRAAYPAQQKPTDMTLQPLKPNRSASKFDSIIEESRR
jgi:hypothetical protein